jgi:hypothetical protein
MEVSAISMASLVDYKTLWNRVYDGLDFMIEHFEDCEETPRRRTRFPRTVATGATRGGQRSVKDRGEAMMFYKAALYEDCYLNAYSNYEEMQQNGELPLTYKPLPRHVLIDLDRAPFQSDEELETALKETLANIKENITGVAGEDPTIVWSGNGYHVHIPLDGWTSPLEDMPEFYNFRHYPDLANRFLRFAERRLSNYKADQHHNPSIKSCLFRVPGTINTKAKAAGKDPYVRVVQGHYPMLVHIDPFSSLPTNKFLNEFLSSLIQEVIDTKVRGLERRSVNRLYNIENRNMSEKGIAWIDKLLQTGVDDNRKNLLYWVLAPYLATIRGIDFDKAYHILESWLERCDDVRRLEPDWNSFRYRIRYCLDTAEDQERKPIRSETFREYYPDLYKKLSTEGGR